MDPVTILGYVIAVIIIIAVVALFVAILVWMGANPPSRLNISLSRNPQYICRSGACGVEVAWESEAQNVTIDSAILTLEAPDGTVTEISTQSTGTDTLGSGPTGLFNETGVYLLTLVVRAEDLEETSTLPIHFFAEPNFHIADVWNTGFVGGSLSADETVATHSTVLAQNTHTGGISEIDGKSPVTAHVCSKGMALESVTYVGGTFVVAGTQIRDVEVTVRRIGGAEIVNRVLQAGETLRLPSPELVDDGIEVLSVMRSETSPPQSIQGSQWELHLNLACVP